MINISELYRKHGFTVNKKNGFLLVSFKDSERTNIIVKHTGSSSAQTYEDVKHLYEKLFRIGNEIGCYQYRIISDKGFEPECEFYNTVNVALSGKDYVDSLKNINHIELYSHNDISYTKLCKQLEVANKACIIQPTGTGKSLVVANFINRNPNKKFIVLTPSRFIISEIKKHLLEYDKIVFHTYSMLINLSVKEVKKINPDYIIVDEFHRCGAEEWGTGVNMLIDSYPDAKLIGTTATHIRYLDDKRNMADELFDGNIANHLTLSKALALNILPSPKYISALYRFNDEYLRVKKSISDSLSEDKKVLLERLNKIKLEFENTQSIPKILQDHLTGEIKKIIVFCKDIQHLRKHKEMVLEWFYSIGYSDIRSYVVHSENEVKNKDIFKEFEQYHDNVLDIMFSVNMLNEGIHVKGVSCIIMLRDTESPIIYYQQLGRCLVVGGDKPIIFDLVNNFANIRHRNFTNEVSVETKKYKELYSSKGISYKEINFEIYDKIRNIRELLEEVETTADSWNVFIQKLIDYKAIYGNCDISKSYGDRWLARKINTVRTAYNHKTLSIEKINSLNAIGFSWIVKFYDMKNMNKMRQYYRENGNCDLKVGKCFDYELLDYVNLVRLKHSKGKLSNAVVLELQSMGFNFDTDKNYLKLFVNRLILFKNEFGHCNVPRTYKDKWLAYNVFKYRRMYKENNLNQKEIKTLEKVSFKWSISKEKKQETWDRFISELTIFKNTFGHCNVNQHFENKWLAAKVKSIRGIYAGTSRGILNHERIKQLEEIEFVFKLK